MEQKINNLYENIMFDIESGELDVLAAPIQILLQLKEILCEKATEIVKSLSLNEIDPPLLISMIRSLSEILEKNPALTQLKIAHFYEKNPFDEEIMLVFTDVFGKNTQITDLTFIQWTISDQFLEKLIDALCSNTTLKILNISAFNYEGDNSREFNAQGLSLRNIATFEKLLRSNTSITSLKLMNNNIGKKEGIQILASALKQNKTLTSLNLSANRLENESISILCESLEKNKTFTSLNLDANRLDSEGILILCKSLEKTAIKHLNFMNNQIKTPIDNNAIKALSELVQRNKLISLMLGSNKINSEGISTLINILRYNETLTSLNIFSITPSNQGINFLIKALCDNKKLKLKTLDIRDNFIESKADINAFCEWVLGCTSLINLKYSISLKIPDEEYIIIKTNINNIVEINVCLKKINTFIKKNNSDAIQKEIDTALALSQGNIYEKILKCRIYSLQVIACLRLENLVEAFDVYRKHVFPNTENAAALEMAYLISAEADFFQQFLLDFERCRLMLFLLRDNEEQGAQRLRIQLFSQLTNYFPTSSAYLEALGFGILTYKELLHYPERLKQPVGENKDLETLVKEEKVYLYEQLMLLGEPNQNFEKIPVTIDPVTNQIDLKKFEVYYREADEIFGKLLEKLCTELVRTQLVEENNEEPTIFSSPISQAISPQKPFFGNFRLQSIENIEKKFPVFFRKSFSHT